MPPPKKHRPVPPVNLDEHPDATEPVGDSLEADPVSLMRSWQAAKVAKSEADVEEKMLNGRLSEYVAAHGQADSKGHVWFELDQDVESYDAKGKRMRYNAVQRQRRVSVLFEEEKALGILERKGLTDKATESWMQVKNVDAVIAVLRSVGVLEHFLQNGEIEVRTAVSEDAVRAAYFEGELTTDEYHDIFVEKISWALLPGRI